MAYWIWSVNLCRLQCSHDPPARGGSRDRRDARLVKYSSVEEAS
jgi:hypothetical protein